MSRSGYSDDCDNLALWRGAVDAAIHGKRGQALLRDLRDALDAMPVKRLIAGELVEDGEYCALGVLGAKRGMDMEHIDPDDSERVGKMFNIARAMAAEIVYVNDEEGAQYADVAGVWRYVPESPEIRWARVRKWVDEQIKAMP